MSISLNGCREWEGFREVCVLSERLVGGNSWKAECLGFLRKVAMCLFLYIHKISSKPFQLLHFESLNHCLSQPSGHSSV